MTPEEILASRTARFSTIDANGDLSITLDEFKTWMVQKETDRFETLDTDNSNALSKEEFLANRRERKLELFTEVFALADTNVDQSLTYDEFAVFGPQPGNVLFRFAALDTDGDGKISQAEFLAAPWHRKHR